MGSPGPDTPCSSARLCDSAAALSKDSPSVRLLAEQLRAAAGTLGTIQAVDVGPSEITVHAYGPDAARLFDALKPILAASPLVSHAWVLLRYGDIGAPESQVTI